MGKIVAIGGGEIGRPGYPVETTKIDKEIIHLSGKSSPKLLFIPTATLDSDVYIETAEKHFGKRLGCRIDTLLLLKNRYSKAEVREKILSSDIVYVGGGNTLRMMNLWRRLGVDSILIDAYKRDIVVAGLSAGAICWFAYGNSDSRRFANSDKWQFIRVKGLGLLPFTVCPHYHFEKRENNFKKMIAKQGGIGIALDNNTALEVVDDTYRIIKSKINAKAYKVYKQKGKVLIEALEDDNFRPLKELESVV